MTGTLPADSAAAASVIDWPSVLAEHDRWLRTVVLARTGELQAVDEVMQEVALAAVAQRAPLQDPARVAPWLYQLAVRQSLLYRRKIGRVRKLAGRYAEQVRPAEKHAADDPADWLLAAERRDMVRAALSSLAEADAEVLLLKYTEGWNYHQIAAHLDLSHSAVEAKLHRARQKLRSVLAAMQVVEVSS